MNVSSVLATSGISAAMVVGAVAVAVPALAAHNNDYCNVTNVTCAYRDAGYLNGMGKKGPGTPQQDIPVADRNMLSSWENLTGTGARFYYNTGGLGKCVSMAAHSSATVSNPTGNPDNDQAESWSFTSTC